MWQQGSDGCIFKPYVDCRGDVRVDHNNKDQTKISKIIYTQYHDRRIEEAIQQYFPEVVAGRGVLIAERRCIPQFQPKNLIKNQTILNNQRREHRYTCDNLLPNQPELYDNFIYPVYDGTYEEELNRPEYQNPDKPLECFRLLRRALNACVAMIPDNGPWVLNIDSHINNIFVKRDAEPYASLADWGRTIILRNPKDAKTLAEDFDFFLDYLKDTLGFNMQKFVDYPEISWFSSHFRKSFDAVHLATQQGGTIPKEIRYVRLTTLIGILNNMYDNDHLINPSVLPIIQNCTKELLNKSESQQDIITIINKHIQVPGIQHYIDLPTLFPPPPPIPNPLIQKIRDEYTKINEQDKAILRSLLKLDRQEIHEKTQELLNKYIELDDQNMNSEEKKKLEEEYESLYIIHQQAEIMRKLFTIQELEHYLNIQLGVNEKDDLRNRVQQEYNELPLADKRLIRLYIQSDKEYLEKKIDQFVQMLSEIDPSNVSPEKMKRREEFEKQIQLYQKAYMMKNLGAKAGGKRTRKQKKQKQRKTRKN